MLCVQLGRTCHDATSVTAKAANAEAAARMIRRPSERERFQKWSLSEHIVIQYIAVL